MQYENLVPYLKPSCRTLRGPIIWGTKWFGQEVVETVVNGIKNEDVTIALEFERWNKVCY